MSAAAAAADAPVFADAIDDADGFGPDEIREAVDAIDIPMGETAAGYGVKFGENNQNTRAKMMGMQWQDGELVTVFPEEAAVSELKLQD